MLIRIVWIWGYWCWFLCGQWLLRTWMVGNCIGGGSALLIFGIFPKNFLRTWMAGSCVEGSKARRRLFESPRSRESPTRSRRMGGGENREYYFLPWASGGKGEGGKGGGGKDHRRHVEKIVSWKSWDCLPWPMMACRCWWITKLRTDDSFRRTTTNLISLIG